MTHAGLTSPRRRERGLSLVEAIVAVVLISIATPPVLLAMRDASVRRSGQTLTARARWLAAERLETILADRYSTLRGYSYLTSANYPAESSIAGFPGFTRSVSFNITAPKFVAGTGFNRVTVTVSYTDPRLGATSLSLSTLVTDLN